MCICVCVCTVFMPAFVHAKFCQYFCVYSYFPVSDGIARFWYGDGRGGGGEERKPNVPTKTNVGYQESSIIRHGNVNSIII